MKKTAAQKYNNNMNRIFEKAKINKNDNIDIKDAYVAFDCILRFVALVSYLPIEMLTLLHSMVLESGIDASSSDFYNAVLNEIETAMEEQWRNTTPNLEANIRIEKF